jgi:hypothetical protein
MGQRKLRERFSTAGFSVIEVLLIVLVIAALGLGGWYVYHRDHKPKAAISSNSQGSAKKTTAPPPADRYAGWKSYCDTTYRYCFKYPAGWTVNEQTVPEQPCGAGQVTITSADGAVTMSYQNDDNHDGALESITPVSISTLNSAALTVLGSYSVGGTTYFPDYAIVDSSSLTTYPLTIGVSDQFPGPPEFTDQGTGTKSCTGSFISQPSLSLHTLSDTKAWFTTPGAQTSLSILKSFYYNK